MKAETIWHKLKTIISEELGVDESAVTEDAYLCSDLGAESLGFVELIMRCEEEFKIAIDDDVADRITHVRDLYHHLTRRLVKA